MADDKGNLAAIEAELVGDADAMAKAMDTILAKKPDAAFLMARARDFGEPVIDAYLNLAARALAAAKVFDPEN